MRITLKANLWTKKADKDGLCPVAISIRGAGLETYYQTDVKVHPDYWENGVILKGFTNHDILNNRIKLILTGSDRAVLLAGSPTLGEAKEIVQGIADPENAAKGAESFTAFYRRYIDNLIATGKKAPSTIQIWETEYAQFKDFTKTAHTPFRKIDDDFLDWYHRKLVAHTHGKKKTTYTATTVFKKLKKLTQVVRLARRKGFIDAKKLEGFDMPEWVEPATNYLTFEQTQQLADKLYSGKFDTQPHLRLVAAFFLVECYGGIRFSDWHKFEVEKLIAKDKFKVRAKKNKEPIYLDLTVFRSLAKLLDYIKANDMHFKETEQTANQNLKPLGILLGLKFPLRTHYGRHTFATLLAEMGYTTRFISEAMGITERTAKRYIHITKQTMQAEQARIGGF